MSSYIYAMDCGHVVKFGISTRPDLRVQRIRQAVNPETTLEGAVIGSVEQETELHALLKPYRVDGEYYCKCSVVSRVLDLFCPFPVRPAKQRTPATGEAPDFALEARQLLEAIVDRRKTLQHEWKRLSLELNMTERRLKSLWYGETAFVLVSELNALRRQAIGTAVKP
jgi:hypothetical protein